MKAAVASDQNSVKLKQAFSSTSGPNITKHKYPRKKLNAKNIKERNKMETWL